MNLKEAIENRDRLYKEYLIAERERVTILLAEKYHQPAKPFSKKLYRQDADQILLKGE